MKIQKAVAMRMAELLAQKNMSYYALANKSGLTKQAISNIVNLKYGNIKFETVAKIAFALDMTLAQFLDSKFFEKANLDFDL